MFLKTSPGIFQKNSPENFQKILLKYVKYLCILHNVYRYLMNMSLYFNSNYLISHIIMKNMFKYFFFNFSSQLLT